MTSKFNNLIVNRGISLMKEPHKTQSIILCKTMGSLKNPNTITLPGNISIEHSLVYISEIKRNTRMVH